MRVTFGIDDGYAGGNRPHEVNVPDDELIECVDSEERIRLIDSYIQDWMEDNLHSYWKRDALEQWERENEKAIKEARQDEDEDEEGSRHFE